MYNEYISNEQIKYYDSIIKQDKEISQNIKETPLILEVIRAGMFLYDRLKEVNCNPSKIEELQYQAGFLCFGRPNVWEIHETIYENYILNHFIN
jgi:hypothetical protein